MYGTVARTRLKPGMDKRMQALMDGFNSLNVPGYVGTALYKMDSDPNEYYMAVFFKDKDSYSANADSPEQDARYREMLELMDGEPEWHDGEIVHSTGIR